MKKTDMLLWIEALDDCLEGFEARLGAYEARLAVVEAQKPAPEVNASTGGYTCCKCNQNLTEFEMLHHVCENKGGRYLTAEQVMVLKDLRDRLDGAPVSYPIIDELLEALNDILK